MSGRCRLQCGISLQVFGLRQVGSSGHPPECSDDSGCSGGMLCSSGTCTLPGRPGEMPNPEDFFKIASSNTHTCALRYNGKLYCWGLNDSGQLGIAGSTTNHIQPILVSEEGPWKSVHPGIEHTCAIKEDNTLYCWGKNLYGQLGDGTNSLRNVPTPVSGGLTWKTVVLSYDFTCGISISDELYCWGKNLDGQLGTGDAWSEVPTQVLMP